MKTYIIAILLIFIPTAGFSSAELTGNPDELRRLLHPKEKVITLYANAKKKAYTDKATVSLIVTTEDKLLSVAITENADLRASISESLIKAGISGDSIKSAKFSTSPQYGWLGKKPSSYSVVNRMAVSITDESQLREVAAVADAKKEVEFSNTFFEHTKKEAFEQQVTELALQKLLDKKTFFETNLGMQLTPVDIRLFEIEEEEVIVTGSRIGSAKQAGEVSYTRESSFDEIEYEAGISIDFIVDNAANH
ncbi:SIMPL domain-containing protein [uncultured Microbulbifer sp.]|uniref:SIMPL domain-containing protein n=1 Tax=uncultured Microbulbifer sp. TaxID=348147 RepID=UPI002608F724|nr:SIMPL domain-containing protein [uncultured Microbulbifer sp.]